MKRANSHLKMATVSTFVGAFLIGYPVGTAVADKDPNWKLAAIGAGFVAASIPLYVSFKKKSKRALRIYENELMKPFNTRTAYLKIGKQGIGVRVMF